LDKLNATRVVIAHRLSTIRNADRIYVIEAGRLVELGSFEKLVEQGGLLLDWCAAVKIEWRFHVCLICRNH
jgi:ABC-type multidrug transport system fused ATPase/permease subunit